jgi:hypothetical protein
MHKKKRPFGRFVFIDEDARVGLLVPSLSSFTSRLPRGMFPVSEPEPVLNIGLPKV